MAPDLTRSPAEFEWDTILAFLKLLNQFDSDQYAPCVVKRLEAQHAVDTGFDPPMVLLHDVVQILRRPNLDWIRPSIVELAVLQVFGTEQESAEKTSSASCRSLPRTSARDS